MLMLFAYLVYALGGLTLTTPADTVHTATDNELTFVCNRKKGGKEPTILCDNKFTVYTRDLWKQKAVTNKPEISPEAIT